MSLGVWLACALLAEPVGARPYELEWAGRTRDAHPALVDFQSLDGWRVEATEALASFATAPTHPLWGPLHGRLTYRGAGARPRVVLRPPAPLACPADFETVNLWVWGNNWGWAPSPKTPRVHLTALFLDPAGREFGVPLGSVDWEEWFLISRRPAPGQLGPGRRFSGLEITGGTQSEDRSLGFGALSLFREPWAPLTLKPRPARGIAMFPGQGVGLNTGAGKLPFPTRPETILPPNLTADYTTRVRAVRGAFVFEYSGADGQLAWSVSTEQGNFGDVTVRWQQGPAISPCVGGGVLLSNGQAPTRHKLLSATLADNALVTRWQLGAGEVEADVSYTYRLWGKSLVIDVAAPGGKVAEVRYGRAQGLVKPRLAQVPYYVYSPGRPMLAVSGTADAPLFLMGNTCWYLSNASELFGANTIGTDGAAYNGGARYLPRTDGQRNDCYERLFLTVSPRVEEVLPTIPNPQSPYKAVTGTGVWLAHGASNRENDAKYFRAAKRRGLDRLIITDHETMWRDNGESFTFRTRTAPGRGGDESQVKYGQVLRGELGYVYGPYNNYTDFAPTNEFWDPDHVNRLPDGQLQRAWMRCYAPKPSWAVSMCEELAPKIQAKFNFNTAYCDVHTAIPPWQRTDYDARVPGAGTFAATFYAWGELLLLQRQAWGGPVYSEGNHHVFLHGLTDGNYAQDQNARLPENPWFVDFDLRRLHDLGCNFGMGEPGMFYGASGLGKTAAERDEKLDRFLAATVAFGHPGYLVRSNWTTALRSYFMLQAGASAYTQQAVKQVRYAGADGQLLDSSRALVAGAVGGNRLVIDYEGGARVRVNGGAEDWAVDGQVLPPNGYSAGAPGVSVLSGRVGGERVDSAVCAAYTYFDGRGHLNRSGWAAGAGQAVLLRRPTGLEVIPLGNEECGFKVGGEATAEAYDEAGQRLGPAETRAARGLVWVQPVAGAFSYRLSRPALVDAARDPLAPLNFAGEVQWDVVPGATVALPGGRTVRIPADAVPGTHLWQRDGDGWVDFRVVPLVRFAPSVRDDQLLVRLETNLDHPAPGVLTRGGDQRALRLEPGVPQTFSFDLAPAKADAVQLVPLDLELGGLKANWLLRVAATAGHPSVATLAPDFTTGFALRGQPERSSLELPATGGQVYAETSLSCGTTRAKQPGTLMFFMHPPYQTGVGYSFALLEPLQLPQAPAAAVRCVVGKRDGSDLGDGVLFKLAVVDAAGQATVLAERQVARHEWLPLEGDLGRWAGQTVRLKLIADVGPANDSTGDWACWADVRVESRDEQLVRKLQ